MSKNNSVIRDFVKKKKWKKGKELTQNEIGVYHFEIYLLLLLRNGNSHT